MSAIQLSQEDANKLLSSLTLPPLPVILHDVREALSREEDVLGLVDIVAQDLALSAAVIKTANSPIFSLRRLDSLVEAVMVLGASNLEAVVVGISLRNALPLPPILRMFWDEAARMAALAAQIATRQRCCRPDRAYLFSLFRDAGIPVLTQRFDFYLAVLNKALADPANFIVHEESCRATSHNTVGCLLARTWGMPATFSEAILLHHCFDELSDAAKVPPDAAVLIATARLAEHILNVYELGTDDAQWPDIAAPILNTLQLDDADITSFADTRIN
ncbi:MAG: HDOD domain-containing protein [Burkholderiales bacterium]|nr:HDOD domain-containing protein [Burkholderiales bacterium]